MISGQIKNGLHDAHYIEANGAYHFCSRHCFENFFFKNENAAHATEGITNMNIDPGTKQAEETAPITETQPEALPGEDGAIKEAPATE